MIVEAMPKRSLQPELDMGGKTIRISSDSIRSSTAAEYDIQEFLEQAAKLSRQKIFRQAPQEQNGITG